MNVGRRSEREAGSARQVIWSTPPAWTTALRDLAPKRRIRIMIETIYKTEKPERGFSECYVLVLTSRPASERKVYGFMEEHGHWDDTLERFVYAVDSINTEDKLTYEQALAMYDTAKRKLTQRGFIHSFVQDYSRKKPHVLQSCEFEAVSA
jgi:hypothetical protein